MHRANFWLTPKNQNKDQKASSFLNNEVASLLDSISVSSSSSSSSSSSCSWDEYKPVINEDNTSQLASDPLLLKPMLCWQRKPPSPSPRLLPEVIAFTVQCASCYKWRLVPTKEKYEEIREYILQNPFVCEKAREWRPYLSCNVPEDVSQDNNLIWAIDKADIPQTPHGWQRLLRIRSEGSSKFADIYYIAPSSKKLRSMVEVKRFLAYHPEYKKNGVTPARFSFEVPTPLQENYMRKKRSHAKSVEPKQVTPLAWAGPEDGTNSNDPVSRPAKKQTTQSVLRNDAVIKTEGRT